MDGSNDTILFGMPTYSRNVDMESAMRFLQGATKQQRDIQCVWSKSSLLGYTFNNIWVEALNRRDKQGYRWLAMMHADIVPIEEGYLDILHEELRTHNADVVSCVVPIKTREGSTSTAIAFDPDNKYSQTRICLRELQHLPRTFNAKDVGFPDKPLLINTGLWICDLHAPWVKTFEGFTINDKVYYDKKDKLWKALVEPEDWNWSRHLWKEGARVYATTKVQLGHIGDAVYPNFGGGGDWSYDMHSSHRLNIIPEMNYA